jgi:ABC-type antimicrobial peptide transport system permease subunit
MMRILSITVLAIAAVSFDARGARAAEGPWCANINLGRGLPVLLVRGLPACHFGRESRFL